MWALAIVACLTGAPAEAEWLPGAPRAIGHATLVGAGEDGRVGVLVQGASLVTWSIDSGKRRLAARLPAEKWHTLSVAPRTDGETERAVIASDRRIVLVHLRTGRLIGDWPVVVSTPEGRAVAWAHDGARVGLLGWELPGLIAGPGIPVLWVDAETGTVVSQLRLPPMPDGVRGLAALADGLSLAVGTPKRVVLLGPGPFDARTIGIDNDGVVGATRDGIVVVKRGALVVIDPRSGATAKELTRVRAPADVTASAAMRPGGRWVVATARGAVMAIDLAMGRVMTLSQAALGPTAVVVPSLAGVLVLGKKTARLELATGAPSALLLARMCLSGDCQSGDGVLLDLSKNRQYSGAFKAGVASGQGVLRYEDGAIFTGPFVAGLPHGEGMLLTPEGDERRVIAVQGELRPTP